jgi:hypothetical protein
MPYYEITDGVRKEVVPSQVITTNLIDGGFHNPTIRKNK